MVEPWQLYAAAASAAIIIGIYGVASKRNMLKTIISIEIITSSVDLNFLAMGSRGGIADPLAPYSSTKEPSVNSNSSFF